MRRFGLQRIWLAAACWCMAATSVSADATFNLAPVGGIVMASDNKTMIVSVPYEGNPHYYDTIAEKQIKQVEVEFQPTLLAVQGKKLLVAVKGSPKVFVLESETGTVVKEISLPGEPLYSISCHPKQGLVYAVNLNNDVFSIDF